MYDIILSFITAFVLTYLATPSIIKISRVKKLTDVPNDRKSHVIPTPSLGGLGIFAGVLFSVIMWTPFEVFGDLQFILCSMVILFLIGAKDDIMPTTAWKKLLGQLLAATILVFKAGIEIPSFFGVFGVEELPMWINYLFSIFTILVIINAFNLIDGINGLSSGVTVLICAFFGGWFLTVDRVELAILAFATMGSLSAFLKFNWSPAKIFMGDSGSMICGLVASILAIEFIELHAIADLSTYKFSSVPAIAIGVLIIPLYDTLRVFIARVLKGKSPFYADRTHIHHLLLDTGLSHMNSSLILVGVNVVFIIVVVALQSIGTLNLIFVQLILATFLSLLLEYIVKRNAEKISDPIDM